MNTMNAMVKVRLVAVLISVLFLHGCSGGRGDFSTSSGQVANFVEQTANAPTVEAPTSPGSGNVGGSLIIEIPLVLNRAVKTQVQTFRVTLARVGAVVASQEVVRSSGPIQVIRFDNLPTGRYEVEIFMVGANGTVLGTYRQSAVVGLERPVLISDPAYQNTVPDFATTTLALSESYPSWALMQDFDRDGHLDLLTTSYITTPVHPQGRLFLALGTGSGNFKPAIEMPVSSAAYQVSAADVNEDGHLDILCCTDVDVSLLLGNGDGTFAEYLSVPLNGAAKPRVVRAVYLDGDDHLDLITSNRATNDASVLLGNGDGTFSGATNYSLGSEPFDIAAVDVNGDRVLDLVGANYGSTYLSVWIGVGDGTFTAGTDLTSGDGPTSLAVADFNNDSHSDIVSVNAEEDTVSIFLSNGSDGYAEPQKHSVGDEPYWITLGDPNEDGKLDLLVANFGTGDFSLLAGLGGGSFAYETRVASAPNPNMVLLADYNEDGHEDLVSPNYLYGGILLSVGDGNGGFLPSAPRLDAGALALALRTGDFNEDGIADLVNVAGDGRSLILFQGVGDGTFLPPGVIPLGMVPEDAILEDFNEDGHIDILVAGTSAVLLLGGGDGTFAAPQTILNKSSSRVTSADVNEDGHTDIFFGETIAMPSHLVTMLLGRGDATFQAPQVVDASTRAIRICFADLDGDQNLDMAVLGADESVSVLFGKGDGTFENPLLFPVDEPSGFTSRVSLAIDDVNLDSHPDLIVPQGNSGTVSVALGNGDRSFSPLKISPAAAGVQEVVSIDINGDRIPDLVCSHESGGTSVFGVSVLIGEGDGTYGAPFFFFTQGHTQGVAFADFNRDGALDVAVSNKYDEMVSVLLAR